MDGKDGIGLKLETENYPFFQILKTALITPPAKIHLIFYS